MKKFVLVLLFSLFATVASAQAATPTSKVFWDIDAPDPATALAMTYRSYGDASTVGVALSSVVCVVTTSPGVITCSAPLPAFTAGAHTIALTAANLAGESLKSTPLPFTFVVVPGAPRNIRIVP